MKLVTVAVIGGAICLVTHQTIQAIRFCHRHVRSARDLGVGWWRRRLRRNDQVSLHFHLFSSSVRATSFDYLCTTVITTPPHHISIILGSVEKNENAITTHARFTTHQFFLLSSSITAMRCLVTSYTSSLACICILNCRLPNDSSDLLVKPVRNYQLRKRPWKTQSSNSAWLSQNRKKCSLNSYLFPHCWTHSYLP